MDSKFGFGLRLCELRSAKGVSAREMSLALGQGAGYINNLENGHNLPSMKQFFAICTYLEMSPSDFFAHPGSSSGPLAELDILARGLDSDSLDLLVALARKLQK